MLVGHRRRRKKRKMEEVICQYDKFGYCRYQKECKKRHLSRECEDLDDCANSRSCQKRHPKRCKKYASGNCRFGNDCAYKHQKPTKNQDHEDLKVKLEKVEKVLHAMTRKVLSLEEEVKDSKNKSITDDIIKDLKKKVSELCEENETEKQKQKVDNSFDFNCDDIKVSSSTPKDKKDKVEKK